jgi:putative transposase
MNIPYTIAPLKFKQNPLLGGDNYPDTGGRCMDNIFVERLWWTVKYHYRHLHSFENGLELQKGLRSRFEYYNREGTCPSLNRMTPDECYFKSRKIQTA